VGASDLGERVEARALQEEALELARETGDRQRIAETLHHLAFTRFLQGDDEAASSLAEEGLSTYRELDNSSGIGLCLSLLGHLAFWEGDLVRARALAEAGVALAREARSGVHLSYGLSVLGHVARADRDFAAAETHYRDALAVFQQRTAAGDWMRTTSFLLGLAGLWVEWGRAHEAAHLFGATEGWLKAMGMPVPWMPPLGYERDEAAAREALGEEAFADAWAEGQAMTLEQAVEYALLETG
jgi:MalT-like TPR region